MGWATSCCGQINCHSWLWDQPCIPEDHLYLPHISAAIGTWRCASGNNTVLLPACALKYVCGWTALGAHQHGAALAALEHWL